LGTTLTDQNSIQEEIKSRLKSGNTCYHLVQNLLSSSLLSKNLKIKKYRTIILPVVVYGCETWSLTLREVHRLKVFENRVLKRIFGPKRDEVSGEWRKLHNEGLNDLYSSPHIVRVINLRRMTWAGHVACIGERLWPKFNSYTFFTIGVNSPQMSQNKCSDLTHLQDVGTEQLNEVHLCLIFLNIQVNYM